MASNRIVKFTHFYGTTSEWLDRISLQKFKNNIVFAKIYNQSTAEWNFKIYAGLDDKNHSYDYDIMDLSTLLLMEADINYLKELTNIDSSNNFTSEKFIGALENYISKGSPYLEELKNSINKIETSIGKIEESIKWVLIS